MTKEVFHILFDQVSLQSMLVSQSEIENNLEDVYILDIGTFYFFESFFISEFNEGKIIDWASVQEILAIAESHYGSFAQIAYVSNRVHSYSLVPQDWLKFFKFRNSITSLAIVSYGPLQKSNILIEKLFFRNKIKKFNDLNAAVNWVTEQQENHQQQKTIV